MKIIYENKQEMTLIGFSTLIMPDEGYVKCPQFWNEEYNKKYKRLWQTMTPETEIEKAILENQIGMFAINREKEGVFEYWIAGIYKGGNVPEGLKLFTFPKSEWAIFSSKGPLPNTLQDLNINVWLKWYPREIKNYTPMGDAILEVYSNGDIKSPNYECSIWMPVSRSVN